MYNMPRQYPFMFNPQMYNMLPYMFLSMPTNDVSSYAS